MSTTDPAQHYARLQVLFTEGRAVAPERRDAFLAERCADDDALRAKLAAMLAADQDDGSDLLSETRIHAGRAALERVVDDGQRGSADDADWLPDHIGGYRVVRRLGAGGMGVVYEAEQDSPRRRVALKLLHPQLATTDRLRRLRHEAELLGRLHHPGIAQVFDAGSYDVGRGDQPFFAMELIEGVDVRLHVDRAGLDTRARLELLAAIADAVQHAHDRGVIHRDLKPDNVLVDERGQPKVLDFGVARASESSDVVSTLMTQEGVLVGTLTSMAPEQLTGDSRAITPRTDVYALGVLAYELLSGRLPYEIGGLSLTAAIQRLEQQTPQPLGAVVPDLAGDVQTIVSKAMAREPERRYGSAAAFAADLRRYLGHEPIEARPPSRLYRLTKYARRNRSLVAVLTISVIAAVLSTWFGWRASRGEAAAVDARDAAERRAYQSTMLAASLGLEDTSSLEELLASAPEHLRGWEWRHLSSLREPPFAGNGGTPSAMILAEGVLVVGSTDGDLIWFDTRTGARLRELSIGKGRTVTPICVAEDELVVAWADDPQEWHISVWDLADEGFSSEVVFGGNVPAIRTNAEGTWAFHCDDTSVFRVDLRTGQRLATRSLELPGVQFALVAGKRITVSAGVTTWVLDAESLETLHRLESPDDDAMWAVSSLDGDHVAVTSQNGDLILWDLRTTPPARRTLRIGIGGGGGPAFSPDGALRVMGSSDGLVRIWDVESGELLRTHAGHRARPQAAHFDPQTQRVFTLDAGGDIHAWSLGPDPSVLEGHTSYVYPVAVDAERGLIVSGGWDGHYGNPGSLRFWDLATGEPVAAVGAPGEYIMALTLTPDGGPLHVSMFTPTDEGRVFWGDSRLVQIDLDTGQGHTLRELEGQRIEHLRASPGGGPLLGVARDGEWSVSRVALDVGTGEVLAGRSREAKVELADALAVSPDGRWVAVGDEHGRVELARATDLVTVRSWDAHDASIRTLAFSADGQRLVSGSEDQLLRVFSVPDGAELGVLRGHGGHVLTAAFSPDGTRIASGGRDRSVRLWDAVNHEPICALSGHESYVYSLAWTPDGETLVSGSGDGTVRVWSTEPESQRAAARLQRRAIVARVEPEVVRLLDDGEEPESVNAWIDAQRDWSDRERQVAHQLLLAEGLKR